MTYHLSRCSNLRRKVYYSITCTCALSQEPRCHYLGIMEARFIYCSGLDLVCYLNCFVSLPNVRKNRGLLKLTILRRVSNRSKTKETLKSNNPIGRVSNYGPKELLTLGRGCKTWENKVELTWHDFPA